jgi:soluble lytic murein transglycosylase-like protein/TolA-binding protein
VSIFVIMASLQILIQSLFVILAAAPPAFRGEADFLRAEKAQRTGNPETAMTAWKACAAADPDLAPWAVIRIAACQKTLRRHADAMRTLEKVLADFPDGPWAQLARMRKAELLEAEQRSGDAAPLFADVLDVEVQPWWMESIAEEAAQNLIATPGMEAAGFAWFREVAENTIYIAKRRDASRALLQSPDPGDRVTAIYGLLRAGGYDEAAKALYASPAILFNALGEELDAAAASALLLPPGRKGHDPAELEKLSEKNAESLWLRLWLVFALRRQAMLRNFDAAIELCGLLVARFPESDEAGDNLWWLARYLDRASRRADTLNLYQKLARGCPDHYRADDALFHLALAMRDRNLGEAALRYLLELNTRYRNSRYRARACFMAAELYEAASQRGRARIMLADACLAGPGDYYAHRAVEKLCAEAESGLKLRHLAAAGEESVVRPLPGYYHARLFREAPPAEITSDPRVRRLAFFGRHGLEEGEWEALDLLRNLPAAETPEAWYRAVAEAGFAHSALEFAAARGWGMQAARPLPARLRLEFPRAYWPQVCAMARMTGVDPYLILAVAKQESTFRAAVRSHAGATGVMQIMPPTARWMGQVEDEITADHVNHLESPENSIRLGALYLRRMLDRSGGNLIFALASYNAGPGNCDKWRKRFPDHEASAFIEAIPFHETRNYVKRVLGNYAAYHSLYPAWLPESGAAAPVATQ